MTLGTEGGREREGEREAKSKIVRRKQESPGTEWVALGGLDTPG